jgi:hypothetical protein
VLLQDGEDLLEGVELFVASFEKAWQQKSLPLAAFF